MWTIRKINPFSGVRLVIAAAESDQGLEWLKRKAEAHHSMRLRIIARP
jgi:hypothetical protein